MMKKWRIDSNHARANFAVRHMRISMVRGRLGNITGEINFDPAHPELGSVWAKIDTKTIDTGTPDRDTHLRSADFLHVDQFPFITFKSTGIEIMNGNEGVITGNLTIRDVTLPVALETLFLGVTHNPLDGRATVGFEAKTTINREDFGLRWNVDLSDGGVLVGRSIRISLDIEAVLVNEHVPAHN